VMRTFGIIKRFETAERPGKACCMSCGTPIKRGEVVARVSQSNRYGFVERYECLKCSKETIETTVMFCREKLCELFILAQQQHDKKKDDEQNKAR